MRNPRYWLALLYLLATMLVEGGHVHGPADDAASAHEAGCADPRPHVAGHDSPDLSHGQHDCPACQFRAVHHVLTLDRPEFLRPCVALPVRVDAPTFSTASLLGHTSRAPPRLGAA